MDIISFFTGGGFMDIGFERAGFRTIWTNEWNPEIADLHEHGMTALRQWKDGLTASRVEISSRKSILDLTAKEVLGQSYPSKHFGVIGGPPCPDFSIAGKQKGRDGINGKLSGSYVKMICDLQPTFFVMENVPGLCEIKKNKDYLDALIEILTKAGYIMDHAVLNALVFGAPQDRRRFFMVGFRRDILPEKFKRAKTAKTNNPMFGEFKFPFPVPIYPSAKTEYAWPDTSPFGGKPELPSGLPMELTVASAFDGVEAQHNYNEHFNPKSKKFAQIPEGDVQRKSCKRLHRYRYSPTACYGNNEVHFHPWEPRRISVREALRIQTVPDQYVLPREATLSSKFKMIGNGVPCKLAEALATSIAKFISNNYCNT